MSRRHPNKQSDGAIRDARTGRAEPMQSAAPQPQKRHRRRQNRARGVDHEAQRLDAIARWLVSDDK